MSEVEDGDVYDLFGLHVQLRGEPGSFIGYNSGGPKDVLYWYGIVLNPETVTPALFNRDSFYPDKRGPNGWEKDYGAAPTWIVQGNADSYIGVWREDA
ncbi:hypothetical protein ACIBAH_34815 [Streptomyces sp. NPDC051445]|uniref:hypothetical protein n=1 Tax=Streptomyces sp. NPDC051445 TaxID=3365653 RepID=UPI00379D9C37